MNKSKNLEAKELVVENLNSAGSNFLELSKDKKWLRFIVDGKLMTTFHVDYVKKVLTDYPKDKINHSEDFNAGMDL